MFTVNNIDTKPCSSVSIVNFEQVNVGWGTTFRVNLHSVVT